MCIFFFHTWFFDEYFGSMLADKRANEFREENSAQRDIPTATSVFAFRDGKQHNENLSNGPARNEK